MSHRRFQALAERAAREAGALLARRAAALLTVEAATARDDKLAADRAAEAVILGILAASGLPVLAEESGASAGASAADGLCWIVDPLDGTVNYSRTLPLCCVAIALVRGDEPLLGVVYDFGRDELFCGSVGDGAWLNGAPLAVADVITPDKGILATGLPARRDFSDAAMADFGRSLARWRKVRMLGSAALSLAYVAAGRVDAYTESAIMPWDVAAGAALVKAAGGAVRMDGGLDGAPLSIIAANAALLENAVSQP